ncbi:ThiF family adenylyltransferase [Agromyces sp. GXQ0307]|uniref:ThiF family adenylyltransferase n=1 Tax=Agromyces sp. GXQ0307 TaxID=3377835 RepID=UPI00383AB336
MSSAPLVRDPDIARLLDDGYDISIEGDHLIIRHIPYLTAAGVVDYGFLAYPVSISGDRIVPQTDHRIWFGGSQPHQASGRPLRSVRAQRRQITPALQAQYMLSSKPGPNGYPDQYTKVTTYTRILAHEAQAVDPSATATPGTSWAVVDDDSPFVYRDTATSRAGLAALVQRFHGEHIAIVGLGGTGSYILDQVAKTPVSTINIIDGDVLENHNAFRAPGAASLEQLQARPNKVDYYRSVYSRMHRGIVAHPEFLDETNLGLLEGATFVFLASDEASTKPVIIDWLETRGIPFIDVGMGIEEVDGRLAGLLRVVTSLPGHRDHVANGNRIPTAAAPDDDYGRNIQIADLNALNAVLAVIRWKRHLGFYADGAREGFSTYSLYLNELANEDPL